MDNKIKVPDDVKKVSYPSTHTEFRGEFFETAFSVSPDGYLHCFGSPIGSNSIRLDKFQRRILVATATGAVGTFLVSLGVWIWPNEVSDITLLEVDEKQTRASDPPSPILIEMNPVFELNIPMPNSSEEVDLIQLKCAPFEYEGAPRGAYVCRQERPPL